jgi:SAM-dependent methyltransferase
MNHVASEAGGDRARSFGAIADDYDRWRPGPSPAVVEWLVPAKTRRVVDIGAGTGALSRLLVGRADDIVAVEPDTRMRQVLARTVPEATVLEGTGEKIPLEDASADAVVVSSAWHWMDVDATLTEVARVLRPRGILGVVWAGLDWNGGWFAELRERVQQDRTSERVGLVASMVDQEIPDDSHVLRLPAEAPFEPPEQQWLSWDQSMSADQLVGMLGTFSGVIVLSDQQRRQIMDEARQLLRQYAGLEGDATVHLPFRANCWRTLRTRRYPVVNASST